MKTISKIAGMRRWSEAARAKGRRVAFVPTMGCLHEGHLSLVRKARREADLVVVSIFVNPLQFGPKEDFKRYPRNLRRDAGLARREGCDALFVPSPREMYPAGYRTRVTVEGTEEVLCGRSRPGHFSGVATVVLKLVNVVWPDVLLLGQKDAQQAVVIKRMLQDLNAGVRVVVCPTVREKDGLAVSSRNSYLSADERRRALGLSRSLFLARRLVRTGERRAAVIIAGMRKVLSEAGVTDVDYLEILDAAELTPLRRLDGDVLIAAAARVGRTRLIDNVRLKV
ncbi:MAG: pantoate--beta-alanine ligase [Candidatus Eisenbacteria bacterium]|nr:pantoate--beta-alanine ligase [Candidatus Eisenbacteria bacterium]